LEFELRAEVTHGLDIYGTYSHLAGDATPRFPRNFGALAVNYRMGHLNINVNGIARGKTDAIVLATGGTQDAYVLVNARAEYALNPHLAVFVNGRNLFDQKYQTPASLIPVGIPNDGVLFLAGVIAQ